MRTYKTLRKTVLTSLLEWLWTCRSWSLDHLAQWSKPWVSDKLVFMFESNRHPYMFLFRLVRTHPLPKTRTSPMYRLWYPYFFNFISFLDGRPCHPSWLVFVSKRPRPRLVCILDSNFVYRLKASPRRVSSD